MGVTAPNSPVLTISSLQIVSLRHTRGLAFPGCCRCPLGGLRSRHHPLCAGMCVRVPLYMCVCVCVEVLNT